MQEYYSCLLISIKLLNYWLLISYAMPMPLHNTYLYNTLIVWQWYNYGCDCRRTVEGSDEAR